jgi:hypothetical protein
MHTDILDHWLGNSGQPLDLDVVDMMEDLPSFEASVTQTITRAKLSGETNFDSGWVSTRAQEGESLDWYYALNGFEYRVTYVTGFEDRGGYKVDAIRLTTGAFLVSVGMTCHIMLVLSMCT